MQRLCCRILRPQGLPYATHRFRSVSNAGPKSHVKGDSRRPKEQFIGRPKEQFIGGPKEQFSRRLKEQFIGGPKHHFHRQGQPLPEIDTNDGRDLSDEAAVLIFKAKVKGWTKRQGLLKRMQSFGIPLDHAPILLEAFVSAVAADDLSSTPEKIAEYDVRRIAIVTEEERNGVADQTYSRAFFRWAAKREHQDTLSQLVEPATISSIQQLWEAARMEYPWEQFGLARSIRRKIIMHVGPTNSGKTHHALRALAAAPKLGVYAGPLRLLAHEIYERLNLGQIVPAGVEETEVEDATNDTGGVDLGDGAPVVIRQGNPKYARPCNMITGEEHKIVADYAPLTSCTVEMLRFNVRYNVAVIDEIQLLNDPERGGAWAHAVMGIAADEVHLCGEATAIPTIQALVKHTGDELVINHYERLTPLTVETVSLNGDITKLRAGDCIVAFSRSMIFALKKQIEERTNFRCAVAYGRLPPELRSEQAALFNDPDSGYDIIVGSDAIGMGLNLKIKRIVFEAVHKYNGIGTVALSISQTKQIAGRAGRYGLHSDSDAGGTVTTLYSGDLPILTRRLPKPVPSFLFMTQQPPGQIFDAIAAALPSHSRTETVYEAISFVSAIDPLFTPQVHKNLLDRTRILDGLIPEMVLQEKVKFLSAPVPWLDPRSEDAIRSIGNMYRENLRVNLTDLLEGSQYTQVFSEIEAKIARGLAPKSNQDELNELEAMHKVVVLYLWLSFRNPVIYPDYEETDKLKERVEMALDWALQGVTVRKREMESGDFDRRRERRELLREAPFRYATGESLVPRQKRYRDVSSEV